MVGVVGSNPIAPTRFLKSGKSQIKPWYLLFTPLIFVTELDARLVLRTHY